MAPSGLAILIGAGPATVSPNGTAKWSESSLIYPGCRYSTYSRSSSPRKPCRRPFGPQPGQTQLSGLHPPFPDRECHYRDVPYRHISRFTLQSLQRHSFSTLVQGPEAKSLHLQRQTRIEEAIPRGNLRRLHLKPKHLRWRRYGLLPRDD